MRQENEEQVLSTDAPYSFRGTRPGIRYLRLIGLDPWYYSFNPWEGSGYVWHCLIIDQEDNEMMRLYKVLLPGMALPPPPPPMP